MLVFLLERKRHGSSLWLREGPPFPTAVWGAFMLLQGGAGVGGALGVGSAGRKGF